VLNILNGQNIDSKRNSVSFDAANQRVWLNWWNRVNIWL